MTLPYRKKLIEVALPLKAINDAAAKEKNIRHGHPSTLHLWWARRPLAACRAVLLASLIDDPDCDPAYRKRDGKVDEERAGFKRADLFNLIEAFVKWESSNDADLIRSVQSEIARCVASRLIETGKFTGDYIAGDGWTVGDIATKCHCKPKSGGVDKKTERQIWYFDVKHLPPLKVLSDFLAKHAPPALDPFCGGGSIPLEAQRLGLRSYGSDLNPVPVLITKALIEIPPHFSGRPPMNPGWQLKSSEEKAATIWEGAQGLAEDVRFYGNWMRDEAEKRLGHLYPTIKITKDIAKNREDLRLLVGQDATVIAYRIARTVPSPDPAFKDSKVPLLSSFWLNDKAGHEAWVEPIIDKRNQQYSFRIRVGAPEPALRETVANGTKMARGRFRCLLSGQPIPPEDIKNSGVAHSLGTFPFAIVAQVDGQRVYLPGDSAAIPATEDVNYLDDLPCPQISGYFNPPIYGYTTFGSLFSPRQKVTLDCFCSLVSEVHALCINHKCEPSYANAICTYLALAVSRLSNRLNTFCIWHAGRQTVEQIFSEQGVPMAWDYAEANPFSGATGSWDAALDWIPRCIENSPCGTGSATQSDAASISSTLGPFLISTDPPYYSSITYADFADFFYGTLRKCIRKLYPELLATISCPKEDEAVAAWHRFGGDREAAGRHFTQKLLAAIKATAKAVNQDYPLTIYYAFKQQDLEGENGLITAWESILTVVIDGGLNVLHTWPMRTEQVTGRKSYKNSLASSIVIVCRPPNAGAVQINRRELLDSLRRDLPEAVRHLQQASIAPVDLAQAAIGPGMAVFTRFSRVLEPDGAKMSVRTALGLINQVLDEVLAEQEGEFDVDTRWALAWYDQFGLEEGKFGDAETLSKAKNTAVRGLEDAGIVIARGGRVRLLKRNELLEGWDPTTDKRLTVWEMTQYLIRILQNEGEAKAADLVHKLGSKAEVARDLAYRLYSVCERKKWADEALAYNSLVVAWPELVRLSLAAPATARETQANLFS